MDVVQQTFLLPITLKNAAFMGRLLEIFQVLESDKVIL